MSAEIIEFRDYQSKSAIERARKALEEHLNQQAVEVFNYAFPSVFGFGGGVDSVYLAPEKDPA